MRPSPRVRVQLLGSLLTAACGAPTADVGPQDSDDSAVSDSRGDDSAAPSGPGVLVLAGGGSEGDVGDRSAWSARLYGALLEGGDVNGDGLVRVAVLSASEESDWIPRYFVALGADEAFNLQVSRRAAARAAAEELSEVDAVFLKGGDQGEYYDLWNDTGLDDAIAALYARGGGVGGTSAGAMSLSQVALAGGRDYVSADALRDAHTPYLDDSDGGSALHLDFIGLLPGALVDTHFTQRGRLGRMVGAMAKAVEEQSLESLIGVGLEQRTGLIVRGREAEVVGVGAVTVVQPALVDGAPPRRVEGEGLHWEGLRMSRLTQGFVFNLDTLEPSQLPDGALTLTPAPQRGPAPSGWAIAGDDPSQEERLSWVIEPRPFATRAGDQAPLLPGSLGVCDAHDSEARGLRHELLFRALLDHPGATGFILGEGSGLVEHDGLLQVARADGQDLADALLVVDSAGVTLGALAPAASNEDLGDGSLHAAALLNLTLHVLGPSARTGRGWEPEAGEAQASP